MSKALRKPRRPPIPAPRIEVFDSIAEQLLDERRDTIADQLLDDELEFSQQDDIESGLLLDPEFDEMGAPF